MILSSGLRSNSAADDAAGLPISEKMRGQIRGLNRGSTNIQDGISLIQVADGALSEVHSLLQRGRELSVQGANYTEFNNIKLLNLTNADTGAIGGADADVHSGNLGLSNVDIVNQASTIIEQANQQLQAILKLLKAG